MWEKNSKTVLKASFPKYAQKKAV